MSTWVPPTHGGSSLKTPFPMRLRNDEGHGRRTIIGPDGDGIQFIQAFPIKQTHPRKHGSVWDLHIDWEILGPFRGCRRLQGI